MNQLSNPGFIHIDDYDYSLPNDRIPDFPAGERSSSKLLAYRNGNISEHSFQEIELMLNPGDLLVFNNTKVIKARLLFRKITGAEIEIFLLDPYEPLDYARNFASHQRVSWICMIGNAKKWKDGELIRELTHNSLTVSVHITKKAISEGKFIVNFTWDHEISFAMLVALMGEIPLPPYIHREAVLSDEERYQTVYAKQDGSVAAPTAGLHFSEPLLKSLKEKGVKMAELTLHIGAGTFKPVNSGQISDHEMHSERIIIDHSLLEKLSGSESITAVGTTSVRTLESLPYLAYLIQQGQQNLHIDQWMPYQNLEIPNRAMTMKILSEHLKSNHLAIIEASTAIFIVPSFEFRIISNLITNFHLPKSTLLLLVSAFIGDDWRKVYNFALKNDFRFLSYGDSSILFGKQN